MMTTEKTTKAFREDIGKVTDDLDYAWEYIFHISRNLHKYADDSRFSEIVAIVKKYEGAIYALSYEFNEELLHFFNNNMSESEKQ